MYSNCCGAEPSFLSEDRCGDCLEWAEFDEFDELEEDSEELTSEELNELMSIYYNN